MLPFSVSISILYFFGFSSLSFPKLKTEHSGNYTCIASNAAAKHSQSAALVVNGKLDHFICRIYFGLHSEWTLLNLFCDSKFKQDRSTTCFNYPVEQVHYLSVVYFDQLLGAARPKAGQYITWMNMKLTGQVDLCKIANLDKIKIKLSFKN